MKSTAKKVGIGATLMAAGAGLYWLFNHCHHTISRPFTIKKATYVVCLKCGAEFDFDWGTLTVGKKRTKGTKNVVG
jgi:nitrite reductase/ring-hydroxylating ferredoxin subunit